MCNIRCGITLLISHIAHPISHITILLFTAYSLLLTLSRKFIDQLNDPGSQSLQGIDTDIDLLDPLCQQRHLETLFNPRGKIIGHELGMQPRFDKMKIDGVHADLCEHLTKRSQVIGEVVGEVHKPRHVMEIEGFIGNLSAA